MRRTSRSAAPGTLAAYLSEIGRYPLLGAEREQELARLYRRTGSPRAAGELATSNLRFVVKVAAEFRAYRLNLTDLIQEGNLGLLRAIEKFDPERKVRLITYAAWWIRAYIRSYVLRNWSLVRIGTTRAQRTLFFSLRKAQRELELASDAGSDGAGVEKVAVALQVPTREVELMQARLQSQDFSLDIPVAEEGGITHLELVEGYQVPQDLELAAREEAALSAPLINHALAALDERERFIVAQRLMADPPQSLQQLGTHFGVSRERARQLEMRAKRKLHAQLRGLADELCLAKAA